MPNILIITHHKDEHARIVTAALIQKGITVTRWFTGEYISKQNSTLQLHHPSSSSCSIETEKTISPGNIDLVWFRRPQYPIAPKEAHPEDNQWINLENKLHMQALWLTLERSAVWVNPFTSELKAINKIWQLQEASRIGLTIPKTLISNNRTVVKKFIDNNQESTIYKTLSSPYWIEGQRSVSSLTTVVNSHQLPSQEIFQLTPGIYQQLLPKAFEVRATFFGKECIAVKIHNTEAIDWRPSEVLKKLEMSPIILPDTIHKQCLDLMQALDIVFGCFDFVVTPENEYVFLEVNEAGQFLWIEERLPELKMLDTFCNFLILSACGKEAIKANSTATSMKDIFFSKTHQKLILEDS